MNKTLFGALATIIAVLVLFPAQAMAGLRVCNKTGKSVSVSVAQSYIDWEDMRNRYRVEGWWNIKPGECKSVIGDPLRTKDYRYWYFAMSDEGGTWSGPAPFCTKDSAFVFHDDEATATQCNGSVKRYFQHLLTNGARDYTLNLNPKETG